MNPYPSSKNIPGKPSQLLRDHLQNGVADRLPLKPSGRAFLRHDRCFRHGDAGCNCSVTALSQLFPLLQILAGSIALGFCGKLGLAVPGDTAQNIQSFGGGFLATVVTAACIWLASWTVDRGILVGERWASVSPVISSSSRPCFSRRVSVTTGFSSPG